MLLQQFLINETDYVQIGFDGVQIEQWNAKFV